MRLRRRLTLTMALVLVFGLAIADVVTYTALRSFLYGRIDAQLDASQHVAYRYLIFSEGRGLPPTPEGLDNRVSPDVYVMVLGPDGKTVLSDPSGSPFHPDPAPVLPASLRVAPSPANPTFGRRHGTYRPSANGLNVRAVGDSGAPLPAPGRLGAPGHPGHRRVAQPHRRHPGLARAGGAARLGGHRAGPVHPGPVDGPAGPAPARGHDRRRPGRHRLGRPDPARAERGPEHRGGPARRGAQHHAGPDRSGLRREDQLGDAAPPVRGRRLPRTPYAAHLDPGLRRVVGQGCVHRR